MWNHAVARACVEHPQRVADIRSGLRHRTGVRSEREGMPVILVGPEFDPLQSDP